MPSSDVDVSFSGQTLISGLISGDTGATARAANAAILTAAFATPGVKILPYGTFSTNQFTVTASCTIRGQGAAIGMDAGANASIPLTFAISSTANTIVQSTSATEVMCIVTAPGVVFENIHFLNTVSVDVATGATDGAALQFGTTTPATAHRFVVRQCTFKGWWIGIDIQNAISYTIADSVLFGSRKYSVKIRNTVNGDYGDPCIYGNTFISLVNQDAHIYFKSGGGLKINNNKFNLTSLAQIGAPTTYFAKRALWVDQPDYETSVLTFTGNSVENIDKEAVFIDCSAGVGSYHNVTITGNEFFNCGATTGEYTVDVRGRSGLNLHNIMVGSNTFHSCRGINMSYVISGAVAPNTWYQMGGTGAYVNLQNSTTVDVYPQQSSNAATNQVYFNNDGAISGWSSLTHERGNEIHTYRRAIPGITSNVSYTDLFQVVTPEYASLTFKISVAGSVAGNGQSSFVGQRMLANESASGTLGLIGTDFCIGRVGGTTAVQAVGVSTLNPVVADLDIKFTVGAATANGAYVNISMKRSAGAVGTEIKGIITLEVWGAVQSITKL